MNFADAYAILFIYSVVIVSWEGIIKPLVNFIILQLSGLKFSVTVCYGDPRKPAYKEYGLRAHSQDDAILRGSKLSRMTGCSNWMIRSR